MRSFTKFAAVAALALGAGMTATTADALHLKYTGAAAGGFVQVNHNNSNSADPSPTNAGPFNVQIVGSDPLESFVAWCLELEEFVGGTGYVEGGSLEQVTTSAQMDRVLSVFDANYTDSFLTGSGGKNRGAALQLAIWEAIYEDEATPLSLGTGDFQSTGPQAVFDLAQDYLAEASKSGVERKWTLTTYASEGKQDIGAVNAIPLPAAAWLLLGASGALIAAKRRRANRTG